jgi:hypothetical protein
MLQNPPLTVPTERQRHFARRRLCTKCFGFRWIRMSPLFARSLCFWLKIMGSVFSSTHCALKTSIPFSLLTPQKSLLQFSSELSWHPPCTLFVVLLYIVHNMASTSMANTKSQCNLTSCNATFFFASPIQPASTLWCTVSVRPTWTICHQLHLTLPVPLVHLLQRWTSVSTPRLHSSTNFNWFHSFRVQTTDFSYSSLWCMSVVETPSLTAPMTSNTQYCRHSYLWVTSTNTRLTTLPPSCADSLEILGTSTSWLPQGLYKDSFYTTKIKLSNKLLIQTFRYVPTCCKQSRFCTDKLRVLSTQSNRYLGLMTARLFYSFIHQ